jgi:GTPase SAR1 family protein
MLVYDITDRSSFQNIENWVKEVERHGDANAVKMLIGNKLDQDSIREVSTE